MGSKNKNRRGKRNKSKSMPAPAATLADMPPPIEEISAVAKCDIELFKDHPIPDDCPVCHLTLPLSANQRSIKLCCGAVICFACHDYIQTTNKRGDICPLCNVKTTNSNIVELATKRANLNCPEAMMVLSHMRLTGTYGFSAEDRRGKGCELIKKAAELGCAEALYSLGNNYIQEHKKKKVILSEYAPLDGVFNYDEQNMGKLYLEQSAIQGSIEARHQLGELEAERPNGCDRSLKHFTIAARAGYEPSLKCVKEAFADGKVTRNEYQEVLRAYLSRVEAMRSSQRDKSSSYCYLIGDGTLFNENNFPPKQKCPCCSLVLPPGQGSTYLICCGEMICGGCNNKNTTFKCMFCGALTAFDVKDAVKRLKKRMKLKDAYAFNVMGLFHESGNGVAQDYTKAIELWTKAGELGYAKGYANIASLYRKGQGVERSSLKEKYYYSRAAIMGDHDSRHNLGCIEGADGNIVRAYKHFRIAASAGNEESMKSMHRGLSEGHVTRHEFEKTSAAYQKSVDELTSKERDAAMTLLAKGLGLNMRIDHP